LEVIARIKHKVRPLVAVYKDFHARTKGVVAVKRKIP
jgi:hypothetical protein